MSYKMNPGSKEKDTPTTFRESDANTVSQLPGLGDKPKNGGRLTRLTDEENRQVNENPDNPGVTGTLIRGESKVQDVDKQYWEGVRKMTANRPSSSKVEAEVKGAVLKNDLPAASAAMRNLQKTDPNAFKKLNDRGIYNSGNNKGFRFLNNTSTITGKLSEDGTTREDSVFDPKTQKTKYNKYKFN